MSKFCDKCGSELKNENAKFCDKCSAEVNNSANNAANNTLPSVTCPKCGNNIPFGQNRCLKCGSSFEDNKTAVIVGYIVAVILGIFGLIPGIYLLTRDNEKSKKQGMIICLISITRIIFNLFLRNFYLSWIIVIILIIIGVYLWINE